MNIQEFFKLPPNPAGPQHPPHNAALRTDTYWRDYVAIFERYLIPFFGRLMFEEITPKVIAEFDCWRNTQLGKIPRISTMRTHASAFNRVLDAAKTR